MYVCAAVKLLCGLEASQGPVQEVLSSADGVSQADPDSSDEQEADGDSKGTRKKKNKRRKGTGNTHGNRYYRNAKVQEHSHDNHHYRDAEV